MIVTLKAPSPRKGAGMQFECIKMGVECDVFDGLHYDLTIHDITRAEMIATKFPLAVYLYTSSGFSAIANTGSATPGE